MIENVKNQFLKLFEDIDVDDTEENDDGIWIRIKDFFKFKNKQNIIQETKLKNYNEHRYYTRLQAIDIANKEKNLRTSIYKEAKSNGIIYGLIEFRDFYSTLVVSNNRFAWYIKVTDGKYGKREDYKNYKGYINERLNIRCLVYVDNGEYEYLNIDYDTRNIRMASDDEFIEYINNIKH